jgi:cation diffusion facilitator family transporter
VTAARRFLRSPYGVMSIVLAMYVAKVISKLAVGDRVNSPMITGDGYHNIADIFEALLVIATVFFASRPADGAYPLGRKNAESLLSFLIGGALLVMACKLAVGSLFGLAGSKLFQHEPLLMGPEHFWWVAGVTGGSMALSFVIGAYQIRIGRAGGYESLTADGQETRSDGMIEAAAFAGVLSEYAFDAPRIEHAFALLVAFKMGQTGREIAGRGLAALLQRSLGAEAEGAVRGAVLSIHGVADVGSLKTFRVGQKAVVIIKIVTRCGPAANRLIKEAAVARMTAALKEAGQEAGEFFVRFDRPDPDWHRLAVLIVHKDGRARVAEPHEASHLRICNIDDGECVRTKDRPLPKTTDAIAALIREKRIRALLLPDTESVEAGELESRGVTVSRAPSLDPGQYGF